MVTMELTHFNSEGRARMVDVSEKTSTARIAKAQAVVRLNGETYEKVRSGGMKKGDVLAVAQVAGIMAAKRTSDLIPMCHPLMLSKCAVDFELFPEENAIEATCTVKVSGKTGVEMEALTGTSVALLTIYDMCKAIDKTMTITDVHLVRKEGGKSGLFVNET